METTFSRSRYDSPVLTSRSDTMEDVKVEDDDEDDDDDLFKSARGLEPRGLEPEPAKVRVFTVQCCFYIYSTSHKRHNVPSEVFCTYVSSHQSD